MICSTINEDYGFCGADSYIGSFVQRVVFINKRDVKSFDIYGGKNIIFEMKPFKRGYAFDYSEKQLEVLGNFEYVTKINYTKYKHNVQVPLASLLNSNVLKKLADAEYFCALLDNKDNVFIFGFEFGMRAIDDLYQAHRLNIVTLSSNESGLETLPPLRFMSQNPKQDFYDNFTNIQPLTGGDFNADFNNDFDI